MNIVICEDSISDRHKLEKVITKVLIKNNLNSEIILSTNNSADVLNYANKNNQITLYFLDINLHEKFISGIDIANVVRETDEISPIVLITNYSDKLSLTFEYKLKIFDYISKYDISNYEKRITDCILRKKNYRLYTNYRTTSTQWVYQLFKYSKLQYQFFYRV